mmetsp:Transcript_59898/g.135433  ORF Transcript_59898/g.135433 Transcript_59898/m.135433 type:complete len:82 (+) Transcript_59898:887-1132(+)
MPVWSYNTSFKAWSVFTVTPHCVSVADELYANVEASCGAIASPDGDSNHDCKSEGVTHQEACTQKKARSNRTHDTVIVLSR